MTELARTYKSLFLLSPLNSIIIFVFCFLSGILNSILAISLFPLIRILNIDTNENLFVYKYYDKSLNFINLKDNIVTVLIFMVIIVSITALINITVDIYTAIVRSKISQNLKLEYFSYTLDAEWKYHKQKKPGEIVNTMILEINKTIAAYVDMIDFFAVSIQAILFIIVSFTLSFSVSVYAIISGFVIVMIFLPWNNKARISSRNFNNSSFE